MGNTTDTVLSLDEIKTALTRFNQRIDRSFQQATPTKQWVGNALRRRGGPRCPVRLRRLSNDIILRYGDVLADLFCEYPDDVMFTQAYDLFIGYSPANGPAAVDPVWALTQNAQWADEWGTQWRHTVGGVGASTIDYPLADWDSLEEYLAHQLPDSLAPGRLDAAIPTVKRFGETKYVSGMTHMVLYERFHCLRSMENAFTDFYLYPKKSQRLLEALTEYYIQIVRSWGQVEGVDGLFLSDDWGTQQSLMISPEMWRKFFAGCYCRIFDEMHSVGLDVIFHSCGNITEILGDLVDLGVDVIDPLQPEAMDLKEIARNFGGKVAFCGGLSDQQIAHATPQDVRDNVRQTIDLLGTAFDNAYLVAPSNVLTPEIPLENIEAMFEACHRP